MGVVLRGTIVPFDPGAPRMVVEGSLCLADDGRIAGIRTGAQDPPDGFAAAPIVDPGDAFVYPGLIDLHSHIGYNALPLWTHPGEQRPFLHNGIWPGRPTGSG